MKTHRLRSGLVSTGFAILACSPAYGAQPAAQEPWARVPALPTACYQEDGFSDKISAAMEALRAEMEAQQKINDELSERLKQMDPMEQASKMQEFMMQNPEQAMKLMQQNQALGETSADTQGKNNEALMALETEYTQLETRYKAALEKALAPMKPKYDDLDKRAEPHLVGEAGAYPDWAIKEFNLLQKESDAIYEKVCAEWWLGSGTFPAWTMRYKERLTSFIPAYEEAEMLGAGLMIAVVSTPSAPFRPTSASKVVLDHMTRIQRVFSGRAMGRNTQR